MKFSMVNGSTIRHGDHACVYADLKVACGHDVTITLETPSQRMRGKPRRKIPVKVRCRSCEAKISQQVVTRITKARK